MYGFGCIRAVDEKCPRQEDELDAELEEQRRLEEEAKDESDYLRLRGY
jgi:hypothetical protein